jgi:hypothetical protein
LVHLAYL